MTTRRLAGLLPLCHQGYRRAAGVPYRVATRYDSRMQLDGGLAIVTGAAVGTGRAIAERLATEGADVVVADVDERGGEDLNLRSAMLATQLALEPMRRAGGGAIVNIASTAGLGGEPYESPEYGAAKAGLIRFTSALKERGGVRVACVVPDWVRTARAEAELAAMTPDERAGAPEPLPLEALT